MISGQILDGKNIVEARNLLQDGDGGSLPVLTTLINASDKTVRYCTDINDGKDCLYLVTIQGSVTASPSGNNIFKLCSDSSNSHVYSVRLVGVKDLSYMNTSFFIYGNNTTLHGTEVASYFAPEFILADGTKDSMRIYLTANVTYDFKAGIPFLFRIRYLYG